MKDPHKNNIDGQKVQRHVFKHEINWGWVAISLVALLALWKFSDSILDEDDEPAGVSPSA